MAFVLIWSVLVPVSEETPQAWLSAAVKGGQLPLGAEALKGPITLPRTVIQVPTPQLW